NGGRAGSTGEIFFSSGVQDESFGLFGAIAPVPGHSNAFEIVDGNGTNLQQFGQAMASFGAENPGMGMTTQTAPASTTTTSNWLAPPAANDAMASKRREFSQSNLVSDDQTGHLNASIQDPNLINPWGVAFPPTGPFWVNNNHTGTATLYNVDPMTNAITAVPPHVPNAPPPPRAGAP